LAHHYNKAGQQEKTEEYLIKAGEESMQSGASSEAVIFLKKALEIHLQNSKNSPNPQKIIDLEENLAFALYVSGQFVEAVEYFDKVITFYDRPFPKSTIIKLLGLAYNLILLYRIIYFYKYKPTARSNEIDHKLMKISTTKNQALTNSDPKRIFFESFQVLRFIRKEQFGNYEATLVLSGSVGLFFTGIFVKLGQRIIEWGNKFLDEKYIIGWLWGKYAQLVCVYYSGRKFEIKDEEKVYKLGTQIGEYWSTTIFYLYGGFNMIEWGNEKQTLHYLKRLTEVSEAFDNNYTIAQFHRLNITYNLKFRKIEETLKATEEASDFIIKTDYTIVLFTIFCFRTIAFSFQSKLAEARTNFIEADKLLKDLKIPIVHTYYLIAKSYIEIAELVKQTDNKDCRKTVLKTTNDLVKCTKKIKSNRTEAYRLRAIVFRLLNKPNKALRNFEKSIKAALSYGGHLELSRTYFELGKFLRDTGNKKERLNGMNGTEYLMKAKSMFEDMNLQWDLEEYEKFMEIG